ncbi:MAG: NUDIX hydrolase [Candidatus Omnitrophica bacterium]|nr:NUDIX hydrolase [Candidatus Omnitrophota bacterium]
MPKVKKIYHGKLLNLIKKRQTLPNGAEAELEVIQHPGAALIVPFLTKTKIIMVRQFRPVINKYIYELPAGTLEHQERPHVCARREVVEETGYKATRITKLGEIFPVPGYSTEKIFIYKAEGLRKAERCLDKDEVMRTCIFSKPEVRDLFLKGKIVDAKTICALTYCNWL